MSRGTSGPPTLQSGIVTLYTADVDVTYHISHILQEGHTCTVMDAFCHSLMNSLFEL